VDYFLKFQSYNILYQLFFMFKKMKKLNPAWCLWVLVLVQLTFLCSCVRWQPQTASFRRTPLSAKHGKTASKNKNKDVFVIASSSSSSSSSSSPSSQFVQPVSSSASKRKARVLPWIPDGVKNALASGLATILVKAMLQPFDTIKTIQQIQNVEQSVMTTARFVLKERGVLGLWSGTFVSAVCAAPASALYFGVFSSVKRHLANILPDNMRFLAVGVGAMVGNTLASVLRVPYEVYKQRLQAGMHRDLTSVVMHSWKTEGFIGLFTGGKLASQVIRDVPYAIIGAIAYDALQGLVMAKRRAAEAAGKDTKSVGQVQDALCGALAGGISTYLTTPMDVIKTRLMITDKYSSVPDAIRRILREDGFATFFAGANSRLLHKIPANGLFFLVYESFRLMLGAVEHRSEQ
jgi:solute carrier family 25 S-adenosylmethionine transporter 26